MNNRKVSALFLLALISTSAVLVISLNIEPAQSTIPSYPVSGHVYDLTGNPAGHASVYLIDTINGRGANRGVYCDTAGYYYITVQAGTYNIVSYLVGTNQSFSQNGLVVGSDVTKDMKLVGGYKISGHVYDSTGHTVAGASTNINNSTWSVPEEVSDASGYYAIYAPAGTYTFGLWPPTNMNLLVYKNFTFKITSDMTYDIVMSSGYTVSGVVQYPSGVKVSGVTTYLLNSTGYTFSSGRYTDAQWSSGSYSIVAPPGTYTLQATLNSVLVYKEANVTLKDSDITKDITLIKAALSPTYAVIDAGQSFTYTASAAGGSGNGNYVEYTWYVNDAVKATTNSSTFNFLPPEAGTYSITVVAKDTTGAYSPPSAPVSATVNPALVPPEVSASPSSLDQGQTSVLTATEASAGTGSYSYQWYSKAPNAASYAIISGANSLDYTFATKLSTETGKWSFILNVTDGATSPNTVPSKAVTVLVNKAPTVTVTPQLAVANEGSPLTFTALVSGGSGSMTYEWFMDNTQVGGNSTSYTYVATSGTHSLYVKVTDSANPPLSATSNAVTISTNPALVAPTVTAVTIVIDQGQAFKLNSTAPVNGTAPYLYQWFAREPNGDYTPLIGATSANCSIPTASNITAGVWYLVLHVTDSATTPATVASNVITVTVNAAPTVSISPASAALTVGQSSTFTATATAGSGVYATYQWYVNGTAQQGQNSTTFSFSPSSAGAYLVTATVTDSFGATSSASTAALVQTSPAPTPTPAPTQTPSPTTTPTITPNPSTKATPTPAPTATQNPTATPTPAQPTPTQNITQGPDTGTYVIVSAALAVVVVVLIGFILASKRTKKK